MGNRKDDRKHKHRIPYADIAGMAEDDRIRMIGNTCQARPGEKIGVIVERVEEAQHAPKGEVIREGGKGDRYIRKMEALFPMVEVEFRGHLDGIAPGTELIRFTRRPLTWIPAPLTPPSPEAN